MNAQVPGPVHGGKRGNNRSGIYFIYVTKFIFYFQNMAPGRGRHRQTQTVSLTQAVCYTVCL